MRAEINQPIIRFNYSKWEWKTTREGNNRIYLGLTSTVNVVPDACNQWLSVNYCADFEPRSMKSQNSLIFWWHSGTWVEDYVKATRTGWFNHTARTPLSISPSGGKLSLSEIAIVIHVLKENTYLWVVRTGAKSLWDKYSLSAAVSVWINPLSLVFIGENNNVLALLGLTWSWNVLGKTFLEDFLDKCLGYSQCSQSIYDNENPFAINPFSVLQEADFRGFGVLMK